VSLTVVIALSAAALAGALVVAFLAQRRRAARAARRRTTLAEIAERIDAAVTSLRGLAITRPPHQAPPSPLEDVPAPPVDGELPGRAGLLQALALSVSDARSRGSRLAAAVVRASDDDAPALAGRARSVTDVPVYAVGPRAIALVLPGLGRADALGVLAQIEARCPSSGKAVELAPGEDAAELAARLLGTTGSDTVAG
jgi:hypothetical protein